MVAEIRASVISPFVDQWVALNNNMKIIYCTLIRHGTTRVRETPKSIIIRWYRSHPTSSNSMILSSHYKKKKIKK